MSSNNSIAKLLDEFGWTAETTRSDPRKRCRIKNEVDLATSRCTNCNQLKDVRLHRPHCMDWLFADETESDYIIIDPGTFDGKVIIGDRQTSPGQLFFVLRQFVPSVSDNIDIVIAEMLERNIGVRDIDLTTGMSMLHYVVRSEGIASDRFGPAESLVTLLTCGAKCSQRTLYTDMNAFHLAAVFDAVLSLEIMINNGNSKRETKSLLHSLSGEFQWGTPLHIAVACLSVGCVKILLKQGACKFVKDDLGRTPADCLPLAVRSHEDRINALEIAWLLNVSFRSPVDGVQIYGGSRATVPRRKRKVKRRRSVKSKIDNKWEYKVGDFIAVSGFSKGIIRYAGTTKFAPGFWYGVELDGPYGKNDGCVHGVRYFSCRPYRGLFAQYKRLARSVPSPGTRSPSVDKSDVVDRPSTRAETYTRSTPEFAEYLSH